MMTINPWLDYMIEYSYTFTNTSDPGFNPKKGDTVGAVYQAVKDIKYATLQPFCSAALGYSALVATVTPTSFVTPMATSTVFSTTTTTASIIEKRSFVTSVSTLLSTPAVLSKYPATVMSSACSILVSQATTTSVSTAPATIIEVATQTTLETSVLTVTASPIPSACGNKGIQYAFYGAGVYDEGNDVLWVEPSKYASKTPNWKSTTNSVGGINVDAAQSIQIYDSGNFAPSQYFILNHRGYVSFPH